MKEFFADLGEGIKSVFKGPSNKENLFSLDTRVPLKNALPFAIQHILIMLASNIAPLFIVFSSISGLFLAILTELIQSFVPGRSGEIIDVLIDLSGYLIGVIIVGVVTYILKIKTNQVEKV